MVIYPLSNNVCKSFLKKQPICYAMGPSIEQGLMCDAFKYRNTCPVTAQRLWICFSHQYFEKCLVRFGDKRFGLYLYLFAALSSHTLCSLYYMLHTSIQPFLYLMYNSALLAVNVWCIISLTLNNIRTPVFRKPVSIHSD